MAIELSAEETAETIHSLKKYFASDFDVELSDLKAKLLLNYLLEEIAPFSYNRGVRDAETFFRNKLEDLSATCFESTLPYWQQKKRK